MPAEHAIRGFHGVLRCQHLEHARFHVAGLAFRLQIRRVMQHEVARLPPNRHVRDVVLQYLEFADDLAERLALFHVIERVFQYAVEHAHAEGRDHDSFVVERG